MELKIHRIQTNQDYTAYNIRTYISSEEKVIYDFLEIENKLNKYTIEELLDEMVVQGNAMSINFNDNKCDAIRYDIIFIDDMNKKNTYTIKD